MKSIYRNNIFVICCGYWLASRIFIGSFLVRLESSLIDVILYENVGDEEQEDARLKRLPQIYNSVTSTLTSLALKHCKRAFRVWEAQVAMEGFIGCDWAKRRTFPFVISFVVTKWDDCCHPEALEPTQCFLQLPLLFSWYSNLFGHT